VFVTPPAPAQRPAVWWEARPWKEVGREMPRRASAPRHGSRPRPRIAQSQVLPRRKKVVELRSHRVLRMACCHDHSMLRVAHEDGSA